MAVADTDGWHFVEGEGLPKTVDELVRGGDAAKASVAKEVRIGRHAELVELGVCIPWPSKIICIGLNYRRHAAEAGLPLTETPTLFSKFHNTLVSSGTPVQLPSNAEQYDYEAELGVVIGRRSYHVAEERALDHVWGYCNCNDLSARDLQVRTTQHLLGKTLDGFLPVGPQLVSADEVGDPQRLHIRCWLNGELRQDSTTADMVFSVRQLVSYISQYITLEPGDFIATGTPEGVIFGRRDKVWMKPGDKVEVEVGSLGRLVTPLVS